jgi:hypothetical protein
VDVGTFAGKLSAPAAIAALDHGEFVEHEVVGARIEKLLRS